MDARDRAGEQGDAEVVARVLAGDRDAYALLVGRHQAVLYRHALGMVRSADAAADLAQDSLIRGYSRLHDCQDPARFGAWVFRILRNLCLDYLKDRRRDVVPLEEDTAFAREADDPEATMVQVETRAALLRALETLPELQREAFLLKYVEDRSYEEMAEMLEVSVSALKMRVLRAREALQLQLEPQRRSEL